jgi:hypothetical protein
VLSMLFRMSGGELMATIAFSKPASLDREHRFFIRSAIVMTLTVFGGFSLQLAMGRSSFAVPVFLHVHAFFFFGWTVLYLVQNVLAGPERVALHRRLGWLSVVWIPGMVFMGTYATVMAARTLHVPFFFQPAYFVVMNPLSLYVFAALAASAIVMRRRTLWHRRLMFCAMSIILAPALGRIVPSPLLMPYTSEVLCMILLLFPLAGMIHDLRTTGQVHPAWFWGTGTIVTMQIAINVIVFSRLGPAIYRLATAGSPGANVAPLAFPSPPWLAARKHDVGVLTRPDLPEKGNLATPRRPPQRSSTG